MGFILSDSFVCSNKKLKERRQVPSVPEDYTNPDTAFENLSCRNRKGNNYVSIYGKWLQAKATLFAAGQ